MTQYEPHPDILYMEGHKPGRWDDEIVRVGKNWAKAAEAAIAANKDTPEVKKLRHAQKTGGFHEIHAAFDDLAILDPKLRKAIADQHRLTQAIRLDGGLDT
jgi:hypothetical protein